MTEIFAFVREGVTKDGQVIGELRSTGIVPGFYKRIKQRGIPLPIERFSPAPREE
jgi:pilus assembly protein CpaF